MSGYAADTAAFELQHFQQKCVAVPRFLVKWNCSKSHPAGGGGFYSAACRSEQRKLRPPNRLPLFASLDI
ncbi:hypothetical protein CN884_21705 [Ochrobactrum sp. 30A/1000/2015]|nr:hypothetical protein A4G21_06995 [Brucella intermedia]OOC60187.1 hypothetical protein AS855_16710 [Brucella intermedia M86]PJT19396.1 hypothetical protein CN884_21705 [Ochrobactrum sp. 30A/1000/2015]PJT39389.1 hypothetical protein CN883_05965 [Ochrobactrum sp. 27A/999/2015]PJT43683.1 hypothetical protein CN882_07140 [Ochrobactrum sp. 23A/997/2015]